MKNWKTWIGLLSFIAAGAAFAQSEADLKAGIAKLKPKDFPTQPIEYIVAYPAGGGMDQAARVLAKYAEKWSGDKIIVNNRTGGAGMVGHSFLATQAKNDGYTVSVTGSLLITDALLRAQGRWSMSDFDPIVYISNDPLHWLVSTDGPFKGKSLKDIVQIAKDKPNSVRVGIIPGSMFEFLAEDIERATGAKFLKVPFQGGAPGVTALLGNNVDVTAAFYTEYRGYLDAGKVAAVAVAGPQRAPFLKDVPTFNEALGTKGITWRIERFVVAPKGISSERKGYLAAVMNAALRDPQLAEEYTKMGMVVDTSMKSPQELSAYIDGLVRAEREFHQKMGRIK
jgi:tripartite-type tricarboxylate transporter receptor subunit TctC